ncbi:MAG: hypothetical protein HXY20_12420, partial [Acidobacteria bacterium]|nr:hypothetical protein [Acidobacteriota bacterium]
MRAPVKFAAVPVLATMVCMAPDTSGQGSQRPVFRVGVETVFVKVSVTD